MCDLTDVSPLVGLRTGAFTIGHVAIKVTSSKVVKHKKACANNQYVFIPFVFTLLASLTFYIEFTKIGFTIQKCKSR